jgi:hypothetical protein
MAVKTMKKNTGTGQYNAGWHELTIKDAVDGTWKDSKGVEKRIIDLTFEDYNESMSHRVFATYNKTTNEEFNIANLFRYACAGILNVLNDPTGKNPVIQYDDEVTNLVGTHVNAFFFKQKSTTNDNEYSKIFDLVPVVQETEHIKWTADDVDRLKHSVEKRYAKKSTANSGDLGTINVETTTTTTANLEDIPF